MGQGHDGWPRHDDLERLLADAFRAGADHLADHPAGRAVSGDWSAVRTVPGRRRRRTGWVLGVAVLVAAAAATAVVLVGRSSGDGAAAGRGPGSGTPVTRTSSAPVAAAAAGATTRPPLPPKRIHVTALETDGETYGIGMPVVLYFSPAPTDVRAFERATRVTVDGRPAGGGWYWVPPTADQARHHELEAHYRAAGFWPAHSHVHVDIPISGLSAGPGLVYSDRLTSLDYRIGAAHVSTVDPGTLLMHVTSDGHVERTLPVSLGAAVTPTYDGIKIVMQKGETAPGTARLRPDGTVLMSGPGYTDHPVPWSVRITRSGEYVHAAPWNHGIGQHSTSNGCTNLSVADAEWFYRFSRLGDVVRYARTGGGPMPTWDGVRDWNVPWAQWLTGGPARPGR